MLMAQAKEIVDSLDGERDRFGAVLQAMDAGVIVLDASGAIELMNRRARKMLKLPKSALGSTLEEHTEFPALEALADVSVNESVSEEIERAGPPLQTFLVSATPVAAGGKVLVLRDGRRFGASSGCGAISSPTSRTSCARPSPLSKRNRRPCSRAPQRRGHGEAVS